MLSNFEKTHIRSAAIRGASAYQSLIKNLNVPSENYIDSVRREGVLYLAHARLIAKDTSGYEEAVAGLANSDVDDWITRKSKAQLIAWSKEKEKLLNDQ